VGGLYTFPGGVSFPGEVSFPGGVSFPGPVHFGRSHVLRPKNCTVVQSPSSSLVSSVPEGRPEKDDRER
jgi:hypothetical protein